ncbi:hypothetical protein FO470_00785 [Starkeya sp. 3C]|uniref:HEPN domain-containing protein n=1 Tax=Ancylobacter moscoviensis TaxID=2597768 RepID=A0ABY3DW07_9HYPH|nr:hypothetical protein [Ancylobacter moscoviensis]TSJ63874.1 hypothetical protein FO470_00785 [Ancylobacter moscoviensis]
MGNGKQLLFVAARYWRGARAVWVDVNRQDMMSEPTSYLLSMSVELALKSFLIDNGVNGDDLRKYKVRHNIAELLKMSVDRGFLISIDEAGDLCVLGLSHSDHFYRYGSENVVGGEAKYLLVEEAALLLVARIIDRVSGNPDVLRRVFLDQDRYIDWPATPPVIGISAGQLQEINQKMKDEVAAAIVKFQSTQM